MKQLFNVIRDSCSKKKWSKCVELSRISEIHIETKNHSEISLRLSEKNKPICPIVTLWPKDEDWSCDCRDEDDPCQHVVTAVIYLNTEKKISTLPKKSNKTPVGKIAYRFESQAGTLSFKRVIISGKKTITLTSSLAALATGRIVGPKVVPIRVDYAIESLIHENPKNLLSSPSAISNLFHLLQDIKDIKLNDQKITISPKPTGFIVCINDEDNGIRIYGKQDSAITEIYRNGIALCGKYLMPINQVKLSKPLLKLLAEGKHYGLKEIPYVVSELIPNLSRNFPVEINSKKIPSSIKMKPKVEIVSNIEGETLTLSARIIYGQPVLAFIENDQLIAKDSKNIPIRDMNEESKLETCFQSFFGFSLNQSQSFISHQAVDFVQKLKTWELTDKSLLLQENLKFFECYEQLEPQIHIESDEKNVQFDIDFVVPGNTSSQQALKADPNRVIQAWKEGESMVPLLGGGWTKTPTAWLDRFGEKLIDLLNSRDTDNNLPKYMAVDLTEITEDSKDKVELPDYIQKVHSLLSSFSHIPKIKLPRDIKANLRPYQIEGIQWLKFLKDQGLGALLADDMGLGKTLQSICILQGKCLIIAPTSVLYNWEQEIKRFRENLKIMIYHGGNRVFDFDNFDIILTTYSIMRIDQDLLSSVSWDIIVLDEAQNIKNPESKIAKSIYTLNSRFKLALTGTPVENSLEDIWSLFFFLNPGLLGHRKEFHKRYVKPISFGNSDISSRLRRRLRPFILRRLKSEVAKDLPPRTSVTLYNELNEQERELYEIIEATTRKEILSKLDKNLNIMQILESLLRLRQAACHPKLIPGQECESSSKVNLLLSNLQQCIAGNHHALVFSQWTHFLDLIEVELHKSNIKFLRIDGSTKNRQNIVETFQNSKKYPVLLLSLKAAGIGLNLTAADHVFIMDPWWNPAIEEQAADRSHRIGQKKPVIVHKLVTKNTVEEKIIRLQNFKKNIANSIVGHANKSAQLTRNDIVELLG